jgi:hypothetical protein
MSQPTKQTRQEKGQSILDNLSLSNAFLCVLPEGSVKQKLQTQTENLKETFRMFEESLHHDPEVQEIAWRLFIGECRIISRLYHQICDLTEERLQV